MSKTFSVAVVGATGAVGEAMLSILAERQFPVGKLHVLASARSAGEKVAYGAQKLVVQDLAEFSGTRRSSLFNATTTGLSSAPNSSRT